MFMYDFVNKVEKVVLKEVGALSSHLNLKGFTHRGCCASNCKLPCNNKCKKLNCVDKHITEVK